MPSERSRKGKEGTVRADCEGGMKKEGRKGGREERRKEQGKRTHTGVQPIQRKEAYDSIYLVHRKKLPEELLWP